MQLRMKEGIPMGEKHICFNNFIFTKDEKTGYYLNSTLRKRLHRYVWEFYNGVIPKGYQIHHIDHDKSNNNIENLQLMTRHKHLSMHSNERVESSYDEMIKNLNEKARPKACEWHGSAKGIAWHKIHGQEVANNMVKKNYICGYCNKLFNKKPFGANKFCSNKCKSAWRRREGLDNETRICKQCGKEFTVNKYTKTETCSKSCSFKLYPRLPNLRKK